MATFTGGAGAGSGGGGLTQAAADARYAPVTGSAAYVAPLTAAQGWALNQGFFFTGAPTYNAGGTITGGNIQWPDGATGVYTATSVDANGAVTAYTATTTGGPAGTHTFTVTIPRNSSSQVNGAMSVAVS